MPYVPPTPLEAFLTEVSSALFQSDVVLVRVQEAVSLGLTTWTTTDVVAWSNYRRNVRALMRSEFPGTLPDKPPYPVGT